MTLPFKQVGCDGVVIVNAATRDSFNVNHSFSLINHGSLIGEGLFRFNYADLYAMLLDRPKQDLIGVQVSAM